MDEGTELGQIQVQSVELVATNYYRYLKNTLGAAIIWNQSVT